MLVYVGAITSGNMAGEYAQGISVFHIEESSGALEHVQTVPGLDNPSFLAVHPRLPVLYAGERHTSVYGPGEALSGDITSFAIGADGSLTLLHRQPTFGATYVHITPNGRYVLTAMPAPHCVMAFPVEADGRVGPATSIAQHTGRGVNPSCWEGPYPHSVYPDVPGRRVLSCDMGLDRVMVYEFDDETGRLTPAEHPFVQLSSGAGPRHLALHPSNRFVYTVNELSSTVSAFSYDAETSAMRVLATISTRPEGFEGHNSGAQIVVHPNGRFMYSSNRGHNSIAIFKIAPDSGVPQLLGFEPTQGETPRNFNIDPSGRVMLVANQRTGNIVSFWIDESNGGLTPTGHTATSPSPVCLMFR